MPMGIGTESLIAQKKRELEHTVKDIADLKQVMWHALLTFHFREFSDCYHILKRLKICREKKRAELQELMKR